MLNFFKFINNFLSVKKNKLYLEKLRSETPPECIIQISKNN